MPYFPDSQISCIIHKRWRSLFLVLSGFIIVILSKPPWSCSLRWIELTILKIASVIIWIKHKSKSHHLTEIILRKNLKKLHQQKNRGSNISFFTIPIQFSIRKFQTYWDRKWGSWRQSGPKKRNEGIDLRQENIVFNKGNCILCLKLKMHPQYAMNSISLTFQ